MIKHKSDNRDESSSPIQKSEMYSQINDISMFQPYAQPYAQDNAKNKEPKCQYCGARLFDYLAHDYKKCKFCGIISR